MLALGQGTAFQTRNARLSQELKALPRSRSPEVILCQIPALVDHRLFRGRAARYRQVWSFTAALLRLLARRQDTADALVFRNEGNFAGLQPLLAWIKPANHVLIISADPSDGDKLQARLGSGDAKAEINHISALKTNAYRERAAFFARLRALEAPEIAFLSAGPVRKCLIPEPLKIFPAPAKIVNTGHLFHHIGRYGTAS